MATVGDILQLTYDILNESSSSPFISSTYSYALLNQVLKDIYTRTNLITKSTTISVTSGTSSYSLPSDFYTIPTHDQNDDICIYRTDTTPQMPIKYIPYDDYCRLSTTTTSSTPYYFTISNSISTSTLSSFLILYPTPTSTMTITLTYVPNPPTLSTSADIIPLPDDLSLPIASFIAFLYKYRDRDPNYGDRLFQIYEVGIKRYTGRLNKSIQRPTVKWIGYGR